MQLFASKQAWRYLMAYDNRAHSAVAAAIQSGQLTVPAACERCKNKDVRLSAHHHKGYARKNWLAVQWLCNRCHRSLHLVELNHGGQKGGLVALTVRLTKEMRRQKMVTGR